MNSIREITGGTAGGYIRPELLENNRSSGAIGAASAAGAASRASAPGITGAANPAGASNIADEFETVFAIALAEAQPKTGTDFSSVISSALLEESKLMTVSAGANLAGMTGGYSSFQSQGIEQAILAAASTGEVTDAQIALMMLCVMMQGNEDGDFSMLMQMMASMLAQIDSDQKELRDDVMSSGYSPYVLDTIDREVFHTRLPGTSRTGEVYLPLEIWKPAVPAIINAEGERDPAVYRAVLDQFNVEKAGRYKPFRNGYTYCNIYVWDATAAMGAEIPHYTDPLTGEPRYYPDIRGTNELGAIGIDTWLRKYGEAYGWRETDAETAQRYANEGKPAVTTAGEVGHVQMVCPSNDGGFDELRGVTVAQAGSKVTNYTHISGIYSAAGLKSVRYFIHE